jgi:hypothetical protein
VEEEFKQLLAFLNSKPTFSGKEVLQKVQETETKLKGKLIGCEPRVKVVDEIKKYDVLFVMTIGIPHYLLVHRVTTDKVYGVVLSSKDKAHKVCEIGVDRYFKGNFVTNTYMSFDLAYCKERFARKFENRKEADLIFRNVKTFYKDAMNLK